MSIGVDGLNDLTADDPDVVVDDWSLEEDKDRSVADRVADSDDCPIENDCTATNKTSAVRLRSDDLMMLTFAAVAGLAVEEGCLSDEPSEPKGLSLTYCGQGCLCFSNSAVFCVCGHGRFGSVLVDG